MYFVAAYARYIWAAVLFDMNPSIFTPHGASRRQPTAVSVSKCFLPGPIFADRRPKPDGLLAVPKNAGAQRVQIQHAQASVLHPNAALRVQRGQRLVDPLA